MDKFNVEKEILDTSELERLFLREGIFTTIKRNEYLIRQNEMTNQIGFVVSGIFRLSRIDVNGNEWIIGYSFKNDFVCDYPSFINKMGATVNIQASTDCEVYLLSLNRLNQFWETDMNTQRLGRRIAETMFAEIYQRLLGFYCDTPEQRYQALMKRCPDLQGKLSLKEIAHFLGITPETLSRIRKKILFK
ncbi:Crp/Fnr family transcriptional regulator [Bacteroides fragilis]|jgi:CRP-like cAMP-binding protein|nr:Crp/Fnr family transcriptional regulator [Bacteroides fragilis]